MTSQDFSFSPGKLINDIILTKAVKKAENVMEEHEPRTPLGQHATREVSNGEDNNADLPAHLLIPEEIMENSAKIIRSSFSVKKSSESSQSKLSTDRGNLEVVSDAEQRLLSDESITGVKKFTPSAEKPEQPEANIGTYRRLTPKESLEKIKTDCRLKASRLRFKFARRRPDRQENSQQVEIKNLARSQNSDLK